MDNKQYNALFSFIWNIANDLPNSRKKGYLILGAHDNGGSVVGKDVGKDVGKVGGKNGGDNVPSFVTSCHKSVTSWKDKVATSEQKDATSSPKVATLKKKVSSEEMAIYILEYCDTWRSMYEIAQFSNRDKNYIRNKVLPKLAEKLEIEYPDIPNHPQQRYRTKPKDSQRS